MATISITCHTQKNNMSKTHLILLSASRQAWDVSEWVLDISSNLRVTMNPQITKKPMGYRPPDLEHCLFNDCNAIFAVSRQRICNHHVDVGLSSHIRPQRHTHNDYRVFTFIWKIYEYLCHTLHVDSKLTKRSNIVQSYLFVERFKALLYFYYVTIRLIWNPKQNITNYVQHSHYHPL